MKKIYTFACIAVFAALFVSASVWEGAAVMDEKLPETGNILLTNAFPKNTVVDVINLENGKTVRLVVSSGLDASGLLAAVSRDAAGALGIEGRIPGRVRISQTDDPAALPRLAGEGVSGDSEVIVDLPDELPALEAFPDNITDVELSMAPSELRPPEDANTPAPAAQDFVPQITRAETNSSLEPSVPDPSRIIPEIITRAPVNPPEGAVVNESVAGPGNESYIDPSHTIDPIPQAPVRSSVTPPPSRAVISAPIITNFEKGKYYLQLAAYSVDNAASVESALAKLDRNLPVAVMEYNSGALKTPVYRVLIGPVNLGESGALLRRYKGMYHDAFVWLGK